MDSTARLVAEDENPRSRLVMSCWPATRRQHRRRAAALSGKGEGAGRRLQLRSEPRNPVSGHLFGKNDELTLDSPGNNDELTPFRQE